MVDPELTIRMTIRSILEKMFGGSLDIVFAILSYLYKNCYSRIVESQCTPEAIRNGIEIYYRRSVTSAYVRQILNRLRELGIVECREVRLQEGDMLKRAHVYTPKPLKEVYNALTSIFEQIRKGTEEAIQEIRKRIAEASNEA